MGGKGLKNASFWVINSKIFAGGLLTPPANLFVGEKRGRKWEENYMKKGGKREENYMKNWGKGLKMHLFGLKTSKIFTGGS